MSERARQKERTRRAILRAAAALLRERGAAGTRIADVMSRAGLTVGGFYAHFASKQELIAAAAAECGAENRRRLIVGLEKASPGERVRTIAGRYLSAAHRDHPGLSCPIPLLLNCGDHAGGSAPITAQLTDLADVLMPGWTETAGPERLRALSIAVLLSGALTAARDLGPGELSDAVLAGARLLAEETAGA